MTTDRADLLIPPGSTIGVLGAGQLGRMFAVAAARLGYRVAVFAQRPFEPACRVADEVVVAPFDDLEAVRRFASGCSAVTLEFENVPVAALKAAQECAPVRPGPQVLAVAQDRVAERTFLDAHDVPTAPHAVVRDEASLRRAVDAIGVPAVLKTARMGYDGRGQAKVSDPSEALAAWRAIGEPDAAIYEAWVDYRREISVLVARSFVDGHVRTFGPIENVHENHILDVSTWPAASSEPVRAEAVALAARIADALELEGIMCIEMFEVPGAAGPGGDSVIVNELAPRPHNSGHLTIEACAVSQFEQQVRALCGLPLVDMDPLHPAAAMTNLLGDLWQGRTPAFDAAVASARSWLHLYDKAPKPSRKMGHITAIGDTVEVARERAVRARARLGGAEDPADG